MRPQRRQPTRLRSSWDSPGKNTGVGCHFLLQCMKVKSENELTESCPTLSDPMDCSPPGSSIHGIFQARVLEWGAIAFSDSIDLYIYLVFSFSGDTSKCCDHCLAPLIYYGCKKVLFKSHHSLHFRKEKFPHIKYLLPCDTIK